jgi:hypothetical protein
MFTTPKQQRNQMIASVVIYVVITTIALYQIINK